VDAREDAQLFIGTGRLDNEIDQAGSGVAGLSSSESDFHQSCFKFTLGILGQLCFLTDHSGWWMEVEEEEEAVETIQKRQRILKFQMDLQVVEEGVADEVETQVVFLVTHVSFSSFFMLQPNQLGAGQSDHGPLTSPELRTASCDLHELRRIWFPTCGGEESLSCQLLANL
ncbi:hypothetical protein Tco_1008251, partial [Tanacetum coccineum]